MTRPTQACASQRSQRRRPSSAACRCRWRRGMPEAVLTPQKQAELKQQRSAVLVGMLLVVCAWLEDDGPDARRKWGARLRDRMNMMTASRAGFSGDDAYRDFRNVAWDAADRLLLSPYPER